MRVTSRFLNSRVIARFDFLLRRARFRLACRHEFGLLAKHVYPC